MKKKIKIKNKNKVLQEESWPEPDHPDYDKYLCHDPEWNPIKYEKLPKGFCESPDVINWIEDNYGEKIRAQAKAETEAEMEREDQELLGDDEEYYYEEDEDQIDSVKARREKVINHTGDKMLKNKEMLSSLGKETDNKLEKIAAGLFSLPLVNKIFSSKEQIYKGLKGYLSDFLNSETEKEEEEFETQGKSEPEQPSIEDAVGSKSSKYAKKELKISGSLKDKMEALRPLIEEASDKYNVNSNLIRAVIYVESAYKPDIVSNKGAIGLMQLLPGTAKEMGAKDAFDPRENIMAGTKFLSILMGGSVENKFQSLGEEYAIPFDWNDLTECQHMRLFLYSYNAGINGLLKRGIGKSSLKNLENTSTTPSEWFDTIVDHYRGKRVENREKDPSEYDYSLKTINFANNLGENYCVGFTDGDRLSGSAFIEKSLEDTDGKLQIALIGSEISAFSPNSGAAADKTIYRDLNRKNFLGLAKESLDYVQVVENIGTLGMSLDDIESSFFLGVASKRPDIIIIQPGGLGDIKTIADEGADGLISKLEDMANKAKASLIVACTIPASKSLATFLSRSPKYDSEQKTQRIDLIHKSIQDFNRQLSDNENWIVLDIAGITNQKGSGTLKSGMAGIESRAIFPNQDAHRAIAKSLIDIINEKFPPDLFYQAKDEPVEPDGVNLDSLRKKYKGGIPKLKPKVNEGFKNFFNSLVDL